MESRLERTTDGSCCCGRYPSELVDEGCGSVLDCSWWRKRGGKRDARVVTALIEGLW